MSSSPQLDAWSRAALEVRGRARTAAGRFAVSLLGESLARGATTWWWGCAPGDAELAELLTRLGDEVDAGELLATEAGMRDVTLQPGTELARRWRAVLAQDAAAAIGEGRLPDRSPGHVSAEATWRAAAGRIGSDRVVRLTPDVALGQLRWVPGAEQRRPRVGYSDELRLAETYRAIQEVRPTADEAQACELAASVLDAHPDPATWRASCLTWAAARWR